MKISFDPVQTNHPAEQISTTYGTTHTDKMSAFSGFAVDISGKVMDNNAYGQGRTAEEVMQQLGATDLSVMRDYLTVMSNTMSEEDFHKLQEEGYDPSNMDVKDSVTIIDHIKAALLKGGTVVEGFTTDISKDVLRDITGSETMAASLEKALGKADIPCTKEQLTDVKKTLEKAASLTDLDEAAVKYMVMNQTPTSVDGLYQAVHSAYGDGSRQGHGFYGAGVNGYYALKAEQVDLEALKPQMVKVVEEADLNVSEETLKEAGWLVEKGIPLTPENLVKLHQVQSVELPLSEDLLANAIAAALADGKTAGQGDLTDPRSLIEKAVDLQKEVLSFTEKDVEQVVEAGEKLTVSNLRKAAEEAMPAKELTEADSLLHAKTVLFRTQLIMTTQANLKLMQSGYAIDTAPLEDLVEKLETFEEARKLAYWNTDSTEEADVRESLYQQTETTFLELSTQPAAAMLSYIQEQKTLTFEGLHEEGAKLQKQYIDANVSYETMMSTPRADLGDSIKKAFANVDDILMDMELELHEMNRRAVRILGYNSMDITPELIESVKVMDARLQSVMNKMTPAVTLETIRQGKNPLEMSMDDLEDFLDNLPNRDEKQGESLGKFIHSLEQKNGISEEEKEACIGIYRIFRQIEKKDHATVGQLVRNGVEPSFKNVLSAIRSSKKKGMDYTVDDSFGGVSAKDTGKTISEQVESAFYKSIASQVTEQASPEQVLHAMERHLMKQMEEVENSPTTIEQMASTILYDESYVEEKKEAAKKYEAEALEEVRNDVLVTNETLTQILSLDIPSTPAYIKAFEQMMQQPDGWHEAFLKWNKEQKEKDTAAETAEALAREIAKETDAVEALSTKFVEAMEQGDGHTMETSYSDVMELYQESFDQMEEQSESYIDLKAMQSFHKQLNIAARLQGQGKWDLPVTIQDEETLIHLTFKRGEREKGQVDILFETQQLGKVAARFHGGANKSGYVLCEKEDGVSYLQSKMEKLQELVGGAVSVLKSPSISTKDFLDIQKNEQASDTNSEAASERELYRMAAGFIKMVQSAS